MNILFKEYKNGNPTLNENYNVYLSSIDFMVSTSDSSNVSKNTHTIIYFDC